MNNIKQIAEAIKPGNAGSVHAAVSEAINCNVRNGQKVAIISDPTYELDGQTGIVKSTNNGFAEVELPNGNKVSLQINLLLPL